MSIRHAHWQRRLLRAVLSGLAVLAVFLFNSATLPAQVPTLISDGPVNPRRPPKAERQNFRPPANAGNTLQFPERTGEAAGKIHTVLVSNTNDGLPQTESIGPGVQANERFLDQMLEIECAGRRNSIKLSNGFTAQTIFSAIDGLNSASNDVILVYISTHGGFANVGGQVEHLMAAFGTSQVSIRRRDVLAHMRGKPARLRILVTDSCGVIMGGPLPQSPTKAGDQGATHPLFDLLFYTQGEISMNAVVPGKTALYWPYFSVQGGGFFTRSFSTASVFASSDSWSGFFLHVSSDSEAQSQGGFVQPPACLFDQNGNPVDATGKQLR